MWVDSKRAIVGCVLTVISLGWSMSAQGQAKCLSNDDVKKMVAYVNSHQPVTLNKKLRDELLKFREKERERIREAVANKKTDDALMKRLREDRERNTSELCPILQKYGWPTVDLVDKDGVAAAFAMLKNGSSFELQRDLLPVIIAATNKGEIPKSQFAGYIDRLRLRVGLKQVFGTEATVQNGVLVLFPIQSEATVDARRQQYDLPPLKDYIRALEHDYRMPLIRATGALTNAFADNSKSSIAKATGANLLGSESAADDEVLRVDTNLVSVNVSVYSKKLQAQVVKLEQKDFAVSEDGQTQEVTFFASTDVPFDMVLLLDLSGSTSGKRDLIRKSTQRFIQAARPADRVAIVTFSTTTNVLSPLTEDRTKLMESAKMIEGGGGSNVWDALKFTLDQVLGPKTIERRRAIVFMTDGVDNALPGFGDRGSKISFADLLEAVRHNDTLIVPIFLDTESPDAFSHTIYANARKTLMLLADESGGLYYKAKKIEDLNGVYDQVIEDLGKVYSLGYKPTNEKRDGTWRSVNVQIPNRPDLLTRTRPGYYAN